MTYVELFKIMLKDLGYDQKIHIQRINDYNVNVCIKDTSGNIEIVMPNNMIPSGDIYSEIEHRQVRKVSY